MRHVSVLVLCSICAALLDARQEMTTAAPPPGLLGLVRIRLEGTRHLAASSCYESPSAQNVSVTSWVSMYSRTSWIKPSSNRKTQQ